MKDSKGHEPSDYETSVSNTLTILAALRIIEAMFEIAKETK